MHILCLGSRLVGFSLQRERKPSIDGQNAVQNENPSSRANRAALSVSLPANEAMHVPGMAQGLETLAGLGRTVFRKNHIDEICPEKPAPTAAHF